MPSCRCRLELILALAQVADWGEEDEMEGEEEASTVGLVGKDRLEGGHSFHRGVDGRVEWLRIGRLLRRRPAPRL